MIAPIQGLFNLQANKQGVMCSVLTKADLSSAIIHPFKKHFSKSMPITDLTVHNGG